MLNHYNIRRVVDIYAAVQDRDLGAVGREITRIVDANRKLLPRGSFITIRGQLADDADVLSSACWPASVSPSCWSTC